MSTCRLGDLSNEQLQLLCGIHNQTMHRIEQELHVQCLGQAGDWHIKGEASEQAASLLKHMAKHIQQHGELDPSSFEGLLRDHKQGKEKHTTSHTLIAGRRHISGKTHNQRYYLEMLQSHTLTLSVGPAGSGKTYLAVAAAVAAFQAHTVERIILTRPAVEAGERLGFLPGDLQQKVDPYLRPLLDALSDMLGIEKMAALQESGQIEIAPLAYMRGRTLNDAFVILDEAQNATHTQIKMFLTRLGFASKMVVTGDVTQIDLDRHKDSGLLRVLPLLDGLKDVAVVRLTSHDVVRHPLVERIVQAYEKAEQS